MSQINKKEIAKKWVMSADPIQRAVYYLGGISLRFEQDKNFDKVVIVINKARAWHPVIWVICLIAVIANIIFSTIEFVTEDLVDIFCDNQTSIFKDEHDGSTKEG